MCPFRTVMITCDHTSSCPEASQIESVLGPCVLEPHALTSSLCDHSLSWSGLMFRTGDLLVQNRTLEPERSLSHGSFY